MKLISCLPLAYFIDLALSFFSRRVKLTDMLLNLIGLILEVINFIHFRSPRTAF